MRRTTLLSTPLLIALGFAQLQAQSAPGPVHAVSARAVGRADGRRPAAPPDHDARRQSGLSEWFEIPAGRTVARRPRHRGHGRAIAAAHVLHGRGQRRTVPDHRRRRDLGPDHGRQGAGRVDGRDRRRGLQPRHHLCRHRIRRRAQQRLDRPRRVQDDRRRQDLAVHRASTTPARSAPSASIPTNPNIVWVAADGDIFKANTERGIFKTTDGGKTWKKTLFLSDTIGAMDVELQPGNPNVVYAWMSRLERKPWTIISGSREGGFYKSTDGGETFTKIARGLPIGIDRQGQHGGDRGESEAHLRARRGRAGRRHVPIGRRRADVERAAVAAADDLAAVLLHDDRRRSDERRRRLRRRRRLLEVDGRRQDLAVAAHAARRQPRHLDQSERRQHAWSRRTTAARTCRSTAARPGPGRSADEPADVRDLRRVDRQPVPLQDLRRAAGQQHAHHLEPGRSDPTPTTSATGPAARPGPIMPHPTRSGHRLRIVQGAVRVDEPEDRPVQAVLGRRAVALRQSRRAI